MFRFVADIPHSDIGCLYWEKLPQDARCRILRMSIDGAAMILSVASWVIYVPIGCRHPSINYWQPLLAKTTATCSLPHPETERQRSVNSVGCCIFGNQGIALIIAFILELLSTMIGKNSLYQRYNTDSKLIAIASCKASKDLSLVVKNAILVT